MTVPEWGWDVWAALGGIGVAVALALGVALAADGLRRAFWATVAVALAAGFASAFPVLFPGVTPDAVLPYTLWPRLGHAAGAVACALWALVMVPGGDAKTTGGAWAWRGVGVAAFGAGWWCAGKAFGDILPDEIAAALATTHVPFGCAVLAPLCLAVGAWFNTCRRAAGRWLARAVAVAALGGAAFAALQLFAPHIPAEVAQVVSWRELAAGTGAGVGGCLLVAAVAAVRRRPPVVVEEVVVAQPPPVMVPSPFNLPPKPPAAPPPPPPPPAPPPEAAKPWVDFFDEPPEHRELPPLSRLTPHAVTPPPVRVPPAELKRPTDPDVPDAGSPFSRFIPKPTAPAPPKSRMDLARPPVTPPPQSDPPPPAGVPDVPRQDEP